MFRKMFVVFSFVAMASLTLAACGPAPVVVVQTQVAVTQSIGGVKFPAPYTTTPTWTPLPPVPPTPTSNWGLSPQSVKLELACVYTFRHTTTNAILRVELTSIKYTELSDGSIASSASVTWVDNIENTLHTTDMSFEKSNTGGYSLDEPKPVMASSFGVHPIEVDISFNGKEVSLTLMDKSWTAFNNKCKQ